MTDPKLFTIPAGVPFLPALADALLEGRLVDLGPDGAAGLAATTIYLPTRRAGRALSALLAERGGGRARLLPRVIPLGDADEAETAFASGGLPGSRAPLLLPAIAPLERRLILTRLVQAWAASVDRDIVGLGPGAPFMVPGSPADAVALAGDLEELMDALATEDIAWDALADAVEIDYSHYFKLTLDFVRIAHEFWPGILAGRGAMDPARRRNALLDAEAARLAAASPRGPVIAAGSTGSVPSTARLLAAIARLPNGAVVLPGLDTDLDPAGWEAIGGNGRDGAGFGDGPVHGHPQYNLRRLVETHCGSERTLVQVLAPDPDTGAARRKLLSEILRPADTTDAWAEMPREAREDLVRAGLPGIRLIEAADEREEALAIAIALRETLAEPGRTAALVTPDRGLARRVAAELGRWGIAVEDSAGIPLSETPAGRLARLAADAAALDFHPARLLALLAHPAVTLGMDRADVERAAAALEIGALRGPAPRPGLAGLARAFELRRHERGYRDPRPRQALAESDWDLAAALIDALMAAFAGFTPDEAGAGRLDLVRLAERHAGVLAALRAGADEADEAAADDEALAQLFDDLALTAVEDGTGRSLEGRFSEYPAFFTALARDRSLAPEPRATHRRVKILGLLEARLLHVDRAVLGGLDEGVWPPVAQSDAFLNRPMRLKLGLTPPERRIGQTAHDFAQVLANPDVIVTRAAKREGKPMVPSRFLARLRAFAGDEAWNAMVAQGQQYRDLALAIDAPRPVKPIARPAPQPGASAFPRRLSVTEIETLVRDPYAIYARHVLGLDPLEPLAAAPSAADLGNLFHDILGGFGTAHPGELGIGSADDLLQRGLDAFRPYEEAYPELYALWWPRFERFVPDYLAWEAERRGNLRSFHVERSGVLEIPLADGVFALRARADRIEFGRDGGAAIIDYKTGAVPSAKVVAVGFSPQLTLEAAMLMQGGFRDLPGTASLPDLHYIRIGARQPLDDTILKAPRGEARTMDQIVADHLRGLEDLVRRYAEEGAGYLSRPYAQYARKFAPYDHLARVKEWSVTNGGGEGD